MIDAAGAIYVLGGNGNDVYQDVWVSTDRGAHRSRGYLYLGPRRRGRPRSCLRFVPLVVICACAAGMTWTSRTASAEWAGRAAHTSVIDAAGAIYVIGGYNNGGRSYLPDVWVSNDGGADRTRGYSRVLAGTTAGWLAPNVV